MSRQKWLLLGIGGLSGAGFAAVVFAWLERSGDARVELGTLGAWVSGIGAIGAVAVALIAMGHERDAHANAVNEIMEQRRHDAQREEARARREAEHVVLRWDTTYDQGLLDRIRLTALANSGGNPFYDAWLHVVDKTSGAKRMSASVGKMAAGEDLKTEPGGPKSPGPRASRIEAELCWGPESQWDGKGKAARQRLLRERLGVELAADDEISFDVHLEYTDLDHRRWRMSIDAPVMRIDE